RFSASPSNAPPSARRSTSAPPTPRSSSSSTSTPSPSGRRTGRAQMPNAEVAADPTTTRRRASGALPPRVGRAIMSAVLHAALDAVVAIDGDGRVVAWNPAAERCFALPARDAVGRELAELVVPPELRDRHRAGLARHVAGGPAVVSGRRIEITAQRADGERFPVELTITRITLDGEPLFVAYIRDISDRLRAEAEL